MDIHKTYLPSLALLRSFECAARHQSFTLAAQELHLTQSAISRQVKELEEVIGTPLFLRLGRRVALTQAGREFAADIAIDLEHIRQTTFKAIAAGANGTLLRIATLPTFAARWLIPRLPLFEAAYRDVEVHLGTRLEPFDLVEERFDVAIHYGTHDWPNADLTKLCVEEMIAVASPDFTQALGSLSPAAIAKQPLLHLDSRPTAWSDWLALQKVEAPALLPGKRFDQFTMVIAATVAGLGLGLLPKYLIEAELKSGQLAQVSKATLKTENAYYLARASGVRSPHVDGFMRWIRNQIPSS